jgi:hypothetical protein
MGYPVPANSPQVTIGTRTVCCAAFQWDGFVPMYRIGGYEKAPSGEWLEVFLLEQFTNDGDTLAAMQKAGGSVKYIQALIARFNAAWAKLFGGTVAPPTTEPTTDAQAKAFITASLANMKLVNVNGVPVLG